MILETILHFFFLLTGNAQSSSFTQQAEPAVAAEQMETISGYEESLGLTFFHRLPVAADAAGFGPRRVSSDSLGILTSADSALIIDERTWSVSFEKAASDVRPIASLTKLMSALVLLDEGLDMDAEVTVFKSDYRAGGIVNVFSGEIFTKQDLWMIGLIPSDNVAVTALVRSTGLTNDEFVAKMNAKAASLGMADTSFVEPTGIDSRNVSTARDVAKLVQEAMKHVEITDAVRRPSYSFEAKNKKGVRRVVSTNILLKSFVNEQPYQVLGGKTGFTNEAGYCLSVLVDGPSESDNVIVVLLGADSTEDRFQEVKGLVDWTYANFEW